MKPLFPCRTLLLLGPALLMCIVPASAESVSLPEGWRLPVAGEMDAGWRTDDPDRHLRATGDFNGDGKNDLGLVVISEKPGPGGRPSAIGAFVWLSQPDGGRRLEIVRVLDQPLPVDFRQFGIAARPPGRYETACAAGYADPCGPGEPQAVDLEFAGIECCLFESVTGIFWWNAEAGLFDGAPLSD